MAHNHLVQSLQRGLVILETVANAEHGVDLRKLAEILKVAPPTAFNLARTLVQKGYLKKSQDPPRYFFGNAIVALVHAQQKRHFLGRARQLMLHVQKKTAAETVLLGESSGDEVVISLRLYASRLEQMEQGPIPITAPYSMATALCFQAFGTEQLLEGLRRKYPFSEYGAGVWKSEQFLDDFLAKSRKVGYVMPPIPRPFRMAVPVFHPEGRLLGCLAFSLPHEMNPGTREIQSHFKCLRDAAKELTIAQEAVDSPASHPSSRKGK